MGYQDPLRRPGRSRRKRPKHASGAAAVQSVGQILRGIIAAKEHKETKEFREKYLRLAERREERQEAKDTAKTSAEARFKRESPLQHAAQELGIIPSRRPGVVAGTRKRIKGKTRTEYTALRKELEAFLAKELDPQKSTLGSEATEGQTLMEMFMQGQKRTGQQQERARKAGILELMQRLEATGQLDQLLAPEQQAPGGAPQAGAPQGGAGPYGLLPQMAPQRTPGEQLQAAGTEAMGAKQTEAEGETMVRDQKGMAVQNQLARVAFGMTPTPDIGERMSAVGELSNLTGVTEPMALTLHKSGMPNPQSPVEQIKKQNKPYSVRDQGWSQAQQERYAQSQAEMQNYPQPLGPQPGMPMEGAQPANLLDAIRQIKMMPPQQVPSPGGQSGTKIPGAGALPMPPMPGQPMGPGGQQPSIGAPAGPGTPQGPGLLPKMPGPGVGGPAIGMGSGLQQILALLAQMTSQVGR